MSPPPRPLPLPQSLQLARHAPAASPWRSFWMAGFEGADHVNGHATPLDLARAYRHDDHLDADYARAAALGLRSVRESVGWRLCESGDARNPARFDFSRPLRCAEAADRHGIQILWTLMHYGRPPDVDLFDDSFADRFAEFAAAAARALCQGRDAPVYNPINEISFLAWAVAESDLIHPYRRDTIARQHADGRPRDVGWEAKWRLVRASLRAIDAIRAEDASARFLHIEPLVHIVPPPHAPELVGRATEVADYQWQAWDMLSGRLLPELGGSPRALDLLGVNYYHGCQWELETGRDLAWHVRDARRVSFSSLLRKAWKRYERPLVVAETSHFGTGRAAWLQDIASEVERARRAGVPVQGVCLYPAIDRPDWSNGNHWHNSGLWDVPTATDPDSPMPRRLHLGYAKALRRAQRRLPNQPVSRTAMPHLLVFSHLRWNFVFQRPQHLLSRLARHYHVIFVEEPLRTEGPAYLERSTPQPGVEVLRPHTPVDGFGFCDAQIDALRPLVAAHLAAEQVDEVVAWFYTPMALPLLDDLDPMAVVYDCMDELSAFKNAPPQLGARELALLARADVVLTGGPSLYEAKRRLHPTVLCLPSAVDAQHYAAAHAAARALPMQRAAELQGAIPKPRLGYFGVIDERLDIELVAALADADPAWQIVMVGPVVKIDPASLPRRPNIHWLGQQPYEVLPQLVLGWDVCLMPFAMNESTRFISPTKTLEYMAAGKPVASTGVHDVKTMFGGCVEVADGIDAFVAACRRLLAEDVAARAVRAAAMAERVARYSWDETAGTVEAAIALVLADAGDMPDTVARGHVPAVRPARRDGPRARAGAGVGAASAATSATSAGAP